MQQGAKANSAPNDHVKRGGGSGQIHKEIRCQTGCGGCGMGGCGSKTVHVFRDGVENGSNNVDFTVTVKIPENYNAKETGNITGRGASHHEGCDTSGYKGYVGINGDKNGFEIETGVRKLIMDYLEM